MGIFDALLQAIRGSGTKASTAAAGAAASKAVSDVQDRVEAVGDEFLDFAENKLSSAQTEQDARLERLEQAATDQRAERVERKARAAEELARLKEAMGKKGDGS